MMNTHIIKHKFIASSALFAGKAPTNVTAELDRNISNIATVAGETTECVTRAATACIQLKTMPMEWNSLVKVFRS